MIDVRLEAKAHWLRYGRFAPRSLRQLQLRNPDSTLLGFIEAVVDQLFDRFDRLFGVLPNRFDLNFAALSPGQGQHPHDASAIGRLAIFGKIHLRAELIHGLHQQRRGASVQPQPIFDL